MSVLYKPRGAAKGGPLESTTPSYPVFNPKPVSLTLQAPQEPDTEDPEFLKRKNTIEQLIDTIKASAEQVEEIAVTNLRVAMKSPMATGGKKSRRRRHRRKHRKTPKRKTRRY